MKSSVVEPSNSSRIEFQGQPYQPRYESRKPHPPLNSRAQAGKPKSRLRLAPAEGWLAMLLLAVAVYCVVFSIMSVGWVGNTFILNWSSAAGLLAGLIVAKTRRLPQAILHLAACLLGHWLSIWLTSVIAFHISWNVLIAGIGAVITDPTRINNSEMVFLFYLAFLCFFLGYFGAWLIYRAHLPWMVAIVYCSILLINLNYVKQDLSFITVILLAALILLIARIQLTANLVQWKSQGLYTDRTWLRGITARIMRTASVLMLLALLGAWLLPALSEPSAGVTFWNNLDNAWLNLTSGRLSLQNPASILQPYQAPSNFFGDQLTIAGSVHLPTGEVLHYSSSAGPQYLAGFTYDHFDGHTWTSLSSVNSQNYDADTTLPTDVTFGFSPATTSVTIVQPPDGPKHYLFGPSQASTFDVATILYGDPIVSAWAQRDVLTKNEHYQVVSYISTATPQDLSDIPLPQDNADLWKSDTNYSTLQAYYVNVPSGLSSQVGNTTRQWTQGARNTYAALKMLESHLSDQAQFTYSVDNPPVPSNVDAVSWLLQTHHGYCTYYATAMTIMARQLGIPARVVNGFSRGHLDARHNIWVVDGSDAHSWVQAYFPKFGWINFDPTPGFAPSTPHNPKPTTSPTPQPRPSPPPSRSTPPAKKHTPGSATSGGSGTPDAAAQQNVLLGLSTLVLLCSVLILLAAIASHWWRNLYPGSTFIAGTYWRLCRIAGWAGLAPRTGQTPYEYSQMLCRRVPQEAPALWRLTELFVRERWAPPQHSPYNIDAAEREMQQLWPRMFLRLFCMRTKKQ